MPSKILAGPMGPHFKRGYFQTDFLSYARKTSLKINFYSAPFPCPPKPGRRRDGAGLPLCPYSKTTVLKACGQPISMICPNTCFGFSEAFNYYYSIK